MRKVGRSVAFAAMVASCGPAIDVGDDAGSTSTGGATTDSTSAGTGTISPPSTTSTSTGEDASTSTGGVESESSGAAATTTGHVTCNGLELDECEAMGCRVWSGTASRHDAASGMCIEIGPYELCAHGGSLASPGVAWRVEGSGDVVLVALNSMPFDLGEGPWGRCGCDVGAPFACWACVGGCGASRTCDEATTPEACAELADYPCQWSDAFVVEGDGTGCVVSQSGGRCIYPLANKGACDIAMAPASCEWTEPTPPHVRAVEGGIEVITNVACEDQAAGFMPCWSAPAGDPPACDCVCA